MISVVRLILVCAGVFVLSFVVLYTLQIGLYFGDAGNLALDTAVLGFLYNLSIGQQEVKDGLKANSKRIDLLESKVFE